MNNIKSQNKKKCGINMSGEDEDRKMRKLFVDKLNASITEDDIYAVFSKHGEIEEVAKYQDRRAPTRYFAFVVYKHAKDCVKATQNPSPIIRGRKCACMLAAIGKQFSGYKFFVQKGLLTEEEKKNQILSQKQTQNPITKRNSGKKQRKHKICKEQRSLPSFKQNSTNSTLTSNTHSSFDDATPIHYDIYPSLSHTQCSISTLTSEQPPPPPSSLPHTTLLPAYHRQTKSLHQPQMQYNTPQYEYNKALYKELYHTQSNADPRYRSQSYPYPYPYIQYQPHSTPIHAWYGQPQYYQKQNYNHRLYFQPQTHSHSSYAPPPSNRPQNYSSPPYGCIERAPLQQSQSYVIHKQSIQQSSAPKLPMHKTTSNINHSVYRSHSARSTQSHVSIPVDINNNDIPCPDLLVEDFADLDIEIGLTPSPPPCSPPPALLLPAKTVNQLLPLPVMATFNNLEDAQKASDKDLEAGFIMLASPTASVKTEYNDSEDHNL